MSEANGEMDASGVEASEGVSLEEAAGELAGGVDDEVEGGGVCTLQALGNDKASVWFMVMPNELAPLTKEQRHLGDDWTTLESCEQQEDEGFDVFPVTKLRHGTRLVIVLVQLN
ncbi:hypothetical protein ACFX14_008124 [Malus domestica]